MSSIISVADDVYMELTNIKGKESYSSIIRKLLSERENKENILRFHGKGGLDIKKLKEVSNEWKIWSKKYV